MGNDRCWNCGSDGEKLLSKNTGNVYCADCGVAVNSDERVKPVDPVMGEENGEKSTDTS